MSIKAVFAANLRSACERHGGPISIICAKTGIQRNQMDRYLAGKHLPNERNLQRLSRYLGVSEESLFSSGPATEAPILADEACQDLLRQLFNDGCSELPEGMFETYFPIASSPKWLMRSLTVVRRAGTKSVFRRITKSWQSQSRETSIRGDHSGVVVDRFGGHYFMGLNRAGPYEPSLAIVRPLPVNGVMLTGRSLVVTEKGTSSLPTVMRPVPSGTSIRSALSSLGLRLMTDRDVEPLIAQLIRRPAF